MSSQLHEVVFPAHIPLLVTGCRHILLRKDIIVGVVFLPLLLLPLLGLLGLFFSLEKGKRTELAAGTGRDIQCGWEDQTMNEIGTLAQGECQETRGKGDSSVKGVQAS